MFVRITSAITAGSIMTLGIFYIMQSLIHLHPLDVDADRTRTTLDAWLPPDRETDVVTDDLIPDKDFIEPPKTPKTTLEQTHFASVTGVRGTPTAPPPIDNGLITGINPDGPLVNVIRVEPDYPPPLAARGIEGWVVVQFDVTPSGTVTNAVNVPSVSDDVLAQVGPYITLGEMLGNMHMQLAKGGIQFGILGAGRFHKPTYLRHVVRGNRRNIEFVRKRRDRILLCQHGV